MDIIYRRLLDERISNSTKKHLPYTYLIGWSKLNKWYYGVRYAKTKKLYYSSGCHPDDLWKTYFTSSKYVESYRKKFGEPDILEIRKTFASQDEAIIWEFKVLRKLNILNYEDWLNRSINGEFKVKGGEEHHSYGKKYSEDRKKLHSNAQLKRWETYDSTERDKKISDSLKGRVLGCNKKKSIAAKKRKKHPWTGKKRKEVECPHCKKKGADFIMARWHFENCRFKE